MFDYQAGEKYKLTLIMVGLAGLMAGMFFMLLLSPTPEPHPHKAKPAWADDPDVTGKAPSPRMTNDASSSQPPSQENQNIADSVAAVNMIQQWLPLAWDLSAPSAPENQEKAISYMTSDCAQAYRQNIWTPALAKQIQEAGVMSTFQADSVSVGDNQPDGSIVVFVEGEQELGTQDKGTKKRKVKLQYLVKNTPDGLKIAGISEGGKNG